MPYGEIRVDTITFTNGGVDTSISVSGLAASTTGDLTVTGTISGATVRATTVSGVTVTGTTVQGASGTFTSITGGTATITSGLFASGTAANPSIAIIGDVNTGLYSPGADQLAISTNGTGRLFVDASGRVGIGTSSPGTGTRLHVDGATLRVSTNDGGTLVLEDADVADGSTPFRYIQGTDGSLIFGRANRSGTGTTGSTEHARIDSSGRLLVGATSTAAIVRSIFQGNSSSGTDYTEVMLARGNNTPASGNTLGTLSFADSGHVSTALVYAARDGGTWTSGSSQPSRIVFSTTADGASSPTERMRIDSSGRVGIGTAPNRTLHLAASSGTILSVERTGANTSAIWLAALDGYSAIYSRAADASSTAADLAFINGSTERARIDSSGRLLVGTSTSSGDGCSLQIRNDSGLNLELFRSSASNSSPFAEFSKSRGTSSSPAVVLDGDNLGTISFRGYSGAAADYVAAAFIQAQVDGTPDSGGDTTDMPGRIVFSTTADGASSPTPRATIDSSGRLLVATTTTPSAATAVIRGGPGGTNGAHLQLTHAASPFGGGRISVTSTGGSLEFYTHTGAVGSEAYTERMRITSAGLVGIGTTAPSVTLHTQGTIRSSRSNGEAKYLDIYHSGGEGFIDSVNGDSSTVAPIVFRTGNNSSTSEKARLTGDAKLLVGTSTAQSGTRSQYSKFTVQGNNQSTSDGAQVNLANNTNAASLNTGDTLGQIIFTDNGPGEYGKIACQMDGAGAGTNDYPGRLIFFTTADGASSPTERMRINSQGSTGVFAADASGISCFVASQAGGAGATRLLFQGRYSATAVYSGTECFKVTSAGDVLNTNNSYGAISDIKLKENIVNAGSQWDDLKALQVRNYNFKEGQTHTQIGLIAQEVELVSPGLVSESPDRDEEGNDLGTFTKSVNYSVLYMKAVKALQEAMERIETLEAKVAALEGA